MKSIWISYAIAWLSTAIAVSVGIYYTRSIHCLWFMIIPAILRVQTGGDEKE